MNNAKAIHKVTSGPKIIPIIINMIIKSNITKLYQQLLICQLTYPQL